MRGLLIPFVLLGLLAVPGARPQQAAEAASPTPPKLQYFSGFVTRVSPDALTVSRKITGKETVNRNFVLDSATKIEGKLKLNARVTVRYGTGPDGDRAVHIVVR